ncbi:MAG: GNAT family N-acetyltransferase [candidate division FCPU426 bacterium]
MPISLVDIQPPDETLLVEMLFLALHVPPGYPPFSREILREPEIARYAAKWGRPGDEGVFAREGDKTLGAAWMRLWPEPAQAGYGFIAPDIPELSMAVLPERRHQGIGTALLGEMIARAGLRHPALSLSVSSTNPAVHLYQRFGFQITAKTPDPHGFSYTMIKRFRQAVEGDARGR